MAFDAFERSKSNTIHVRETKRKWKWNPIRHITGISVSTFQILLIGKNTLNICYLQKHAIPRWIIHVAHKISRAVAFSCELHTLSKPYPLVVVCLFCHKLDNETFSWTFAIKLFHYGHIHTNTTILQMQISDFIPHFVIIESIGYYLFIYLSLSVGWNEMDGIQRHSGIINVLRGMCVCFVLHLACQCQSSAFFLPQRPHCWFIFVYHILFDGTRVRFHFPEHFVLLDVTWNDEIIFYD